MAAKIESFFDPATNTYSYVIADPTTALCAVIDPVMDYDPASGTLSTASADRLIDFIKQQGLTVVYLLETHVHADHLTASAYLKKKLGGKIAIGDHVRDVQQLFAPVFNVESSFCTNGSQFDVTFADGDSFSLGELNFKVMHTPGHTPACITYLVDGHAFVGDTLFMPDYGTARADFPGGDAGVLFDSVQKILALPDETKLHLCHDYLPEGRTEYQNITTVADEKHNIHLAGKDKSQFIAARNTRDKALAAPRLLLPSIQINIRAGELPPAESNETRYLKIPLKGIPA